MPWYAQPSVAAAQTGFLAGKLREAFCDTRCDAVNSRDQPAALTFETLPMTNVVIRLQHQPREILPEECVCE
jgi:hypothetical protein